MLAQGAFECNHEVRDDQGMLDVRAFDVAVLVRPIDTGKLKVGEMRMEHGAFIAECIHQLRTSTACEVVGLRRGPIEIAIVVEGRFCCKRRVRVAR